MLELKQDAMSHVLSQKKLRPISCVKNHRKHFHNEVPDKFSHLF